MKLREVTLTEVKAYLRILGTDDDSLLEIIQAAATSYILSYTALTAEEADTIPELSIALMCLCADMYDTRTSQVSNDKQNPIVKTILNMHRRNCIGGIGSD